MNKQTKQILSENIALSQQLDESYNSVLTDIMVYIRFENISEYQQAVIQRDILHMMLDGMRRGESPENVIGKNYKVFCDNVLSELPKKNTTYKIITLIRDAILSDD